MSPLVASILGQGPAFTDTTVNADGYFQATLSTNPGESYTVEVSTNLVDWGATFGFNQVMSTAVTMIDPQPSLGSGFRFYRARVGTSVLFHFSLAYGQCRLGIGAIS
jgi:hypothetical protein